VARTAAETRLRADDANGKTTFGSMSAGGLLVSRDEGQEQAVEQPRGSVVDLTQAIGIEGSPAGDRPELGEERSTSGDEQRDGVTERDAGGGDPPAERVGRGDRRVLGGQALRVVGRVDVGNEGRHQGAPVLTERIAIRRWDRVPDATHRGAVRIPAAVRPRQAIRGRAEGGETDRRVVASRLEDALERGSLEPAMATGGREGVDPALVGPAPERVRVDPEETARRTQRQRSVELGGTGGDGHSGTSLRGKCR